MLNESWIIPNNSESALSAPVEQIELEEQDWLRVWQIAKIMHTQSKPVLNALRALGRPVKSASSRVEMGWFEFQAFQVWFFTADWRKPE